jgi:hypothetical protein
MRYRIKHPGLKETVNAIIRQGAWGEPYADAVLPHYITVEGMFNWLKKRTRYVPDPPGVELVQSMQSLFLDNYHGEPGAGDCDCFTATAISCAMARQFSAGVILFGNGKQPSHIAAIVENCIFDLTVNFNELRPYKKYQNIEIYYGL